MSESVVVLEKKLTQEEIQQQKKIEEQKKIQEQIDLIHKHPAFVAFDKFRPDEGQQFLIRNSPPQGDDRVFFEFCPNFTAMKFKWNDYPKWDAFKVITPVAAFEYDPEHGYIEYKRHDDSYTDDFYDRSTDDCDIEPLNSYPTLDKLLESLPKQFASFNSKYDEGSLFLNWENYPYHIETEKQLEEYLNTPEMQERINKILTANIQRNTAIIKNHPNYREKFIQAEFEKMLGIAEGSLSMPEPDYSAGDTKKEVESKTTQDRPLDKDALPYMIRPFSFDGMDKFILHYPYLPGNSHGFRCGIIFEATHSLTGAFKVIDWQNLSWLHHLHCCGTVNKTYSNLEDLIKGQMQVSREVFKKGRHSRRATGGNDKDFFNALKAAEQSDPKAEAQIDPKANDSPPVIFSDLDGKSAGETAASVAADQDLEKVLPLVSNFPILSQLFVPK